MAKAVNTLGSLREHYTSKAGGVESNLSMSLSSGTEAGGSDAGAHASAEAEVAEAVERRHALVDQLVRQHERLGMVLPGEVEEAMRRVPRHLFTPGVSLAAAYANDSVITQVDDDGAARSSVSAPMIVAMMLARLQVRPGDRVLEIGSGGYNAALLRELVGAHGSVTTLDVDAEVVARAQSCLADAGYGDVRVRHSDGEFGAAGEGPFDRIVVTAGAWDVPSAWRDQLVEGGRLVVPLRLFGLTRAWALVREGQWLVSDGHMMCGFVPMQGVGAYRGPSVSLGHEVTVWCDEHTSPAPELEGVLYTPRAEAWSEVTVGRREPFDDQDLWLASRLPAFGVLLASEQAVERGVVHPSWRLGTPALLGEDTLAYRAKLRPVDPEEPEGRYEFGAYAHGPQAAAAAEQMVEQIRLWDQYGRPAPRLVVLPAGTPDAELPPGSVVDKKHVRVVICWPDHARDMAESSLVEERRA